MQRRPLDPAGARDVDLTLLRTELEHMLDLAVSGKIFDEAPFDRTPVKLRRVNDLAFSGDGEPTACRQFPRACELAARIIEQHGIEKSCKIVLITNATLLDRPAVMEALALLDAHNGEIWAKLDAGTESYYRTIDRTQIPLLRVLRNIRDAGRLRPIVIQSLFMRIVGGRSR